MFWIASGDNIHSLDQFQNYDNMLPLLTNNGYNVVRLKDDGADVVSIAKALIPAKNGLGGTPGFIEINTHGGQDGGLTTGDKIVEINKKNFPSDLVSTFLPALKQKLAAEGSNDLLT